MLHRKVRIYWSHEDLAKSRSMTNKEVKNLG
jgi:hypothetical protein